MKRLFGVLLALIVMLTCAGCGGGDKPADKPVAPAADEQKSDKVGALMPIGLDETGYKRWTESVAQSEGRPAGYVAPRTVVFFNSLNDMVMSLKNTQIDRFATCKVVATTLSHATTISSSSTTTSNRFSASRWLWKKNPPRRSKRLTPQSKL